MPTVELVYHAGCPNVRECRARLLHAFAAVGIPPAWQEWLVDDTDAPARVRGYGSPTVLIDGRDASATEESTGASCRLYLQPDGSTGGAPSVEVLANALRTSAAASAVRASWKGSLAMVPGIGAALLPKLACPACWPAYAGFLTSVGLGFLLDTTHLLSVTAVFLAIAVGALAYGAKARLGYKPFLVGVAASVMVLAGKFAIGRDAVMYAGLALLVGASVWNTWPRQRPSISCAWSTREP
jgi:hypothetical protein